MPNSLPLPTQMAYELDDHNAVGHHDSYHHHDTHQRHNVERGVRRQKEQQHAGESWWDGQQNDERVRPGVELRDQDQEDEDDRKNQADAKALERRAHTLNRAAQRQAHAFRQLGVFEDLISPRTALAEVVLFRSDVQVNYPKQLIVINLRRRSDGLHLHYRVQVGWLQDLGAT